ncbi:DUF4160 domain-containing protein [Neorhizobium tomejilense]|uniref:DUF4160 domain-containing protein n=1 Tax=Neorhizobium tomejilense TaxID=2093828 RepID=UPI00155E8607|nr:DUF4160 domain-containing protein [Neorhizobium tomejilense]
METIRIDLDEPLERELEALLSRLGPDGYFIKHLVGLVDGKLRVEVRANEHPPPHFHVTYDGEDASFSIVTGERLPNVHGLERYEKVIRLWWRKNKLAIIAKWNDCRPTDCQVGRV